MVLSPAVGVMPGFLPKSYIFQFSLLHKLKTKPNIYLLLSVNLQWKRKAVHTFFWSQIPVLETKG